MTDLDAALAATERVVRMEKLEVTIASTGRPFHIGYPADMTETELLEVIAWMTSALASHLAAKRAAETSLIIPSRHPLT